MHEASLDFRATAAEVLAYENNKTLALMFEAMQLYTHPEAWRFVAGGSWCKPGLDQNMPAALQQMLHVAAAEVTAAATQERHKASGFAG